MVLKLMSSLRRVALTNFIELKLSDSLLEFSYCGRIVLTSKLL